MTPVRRAMVALVLAATVVAVAQGAGALSARVSGPLSPANKTHGSAYGNFPLAFVSNAGQADRRIRYSAQARGLAVAFADKEVLVSLSRPKSSRGITLALRFPGASAKAVLAGERPLPGRVNYIVGKDPARWHTGLATYGAVVYRGLWPGIDLAFRGGDGVLKYEFRLRPGASPERIRLVYAGASGLSLTRSGALAIQTPLGVLRDARPVSYQLIGGRRAPIESRYVLAGDRYGFALGRGYDSRYATVIDPGLTYSTFLGGTSRDVSDSIQVDKNGFAYVGGTTLSTDFPTTPGAFDTTHGGNWDAFVTKLNTTGSGLVYSTFLGGSKNDGVIALALDDLGNAYLTGSTRSHDFPTTPGALDRTFNGRPYDAFVTKLNTAGSALAYSTYLGTRGDDLGLAIALDADTNAYVTGLTRSNRWPTTPGAFDRTYNGGLSDAFVTKLNAGGSALVYSTYLGGSGLCAPCEAGRSIALDDQTNAYVAGLTTSTDFPTTTGAFDQTFNGTVDGYVTKLNPAGSGLVYSTYLGGGDYDYNQGIALDSKRNAYLAGETGSADFPTTPGAFDQTYNGGGDLHVTELNASGSALVYSTFIGGSDSDFSHGVAVDKTGNAYLSGETASTDFPTTSGAFDQTYNGGLRDAFVAKLNAAGSALLASTYLGGALDDRGFGLALDEDLNAYVTGLTGSTNFPTTPGAFDESYNGGSDDAFVTKLKP